MVLGKIVSVHGVKGEVKVFSFTDPVDNVLDYPRWTLRRDGEAVSYTHLTLPTKA